MSYSNFIPVVFYSSIYESRFLITYICFYLIFLKFLSLTANKPVFFISLLSNYTITGELIQSGTPIIIYKIMHPRDHISIVQVFEYYLTFIKSDYS
jgi:hypothetical protein